jgi:hypothetical protein
MLLYEESALSRYKTSGFVALQNLLPTTTPARRRWQQKRCRVACSEHHVKSVCGVKNGRGSVSNEEKKRQVPAKAQRRKGAKEARKALNANYSLRALRLCARFFRDARYSAEFQAQPLPIC